MAALGPRLAPVGGFLNFRWGRGDELFVYGDESARQAARLANACAPSPSRPAGGSVALGWRELSGARRKLATQLHSTFVRLGAAASSAAAAGRPRDEFSLVPASREYRACVRQCIDELADEEAAARLPGADADGADADELGAEMERHEWADCILHLCEIFFLERNAYVAEPLVRWVQLHVAEAAPASELLARSLVPERADGYWPAVQRLLLHGRMVEARQLLGAHTALRAHLAQGAAPGSGAGAGAGGAASVGEGLSYLDLLIEHRPNLRGAEGLLDFRGSWRVWCDDAAALERRHAATLPAGALESLRLLRGDVPTLCALSRHWYELVLALLLHSQPTLRRTELEKLVNFAIAHFPEEEYSEQDYVLMAVFLDEPTHALDNVRALYGRGWLLCHLTDLLLRAGQVEAARVDAAAPSEHELSFCEYARALAASRGLWQLATAYLAPLPRPLATVWLGALVAAEPFATDGKADKLMALCEVWALEAEAASIATQMVLRKLRARMPAAALRWLGRTPAVHRQQARCDAVSAALVRACDREGGAPTAGPARGAPAAALARMLGGGGGLPAGGEAAGWVGEFCQLSASFQALHGLRAAAAAASGTERGEVAAAMARGEAEARARVLGLCSDAPRGGGAGCELPAHMRTQVLVDAHAAGLLKAPNGEGGGCQLSAADAYALIGCLHAHDSVSSGHAGGEADGSLPGSLQPVALELCMTLASAILARPQADAVGM